MTDTIRQHRTQMAFMDQDHEAAADCLDRLLELADQGRDGLAAAFHEFIEHNRAHFAREEGLMARMDFPPAAGHKAEHTAALELWEGALARLESGELDAAALAAILRDEILPAYSRHVRTMDSLTAQFALRAGVVDEAAEG